MSGDPVSTTRSPCGEGESVPPDSLQIAITFFFGQKQSADSVYVVARLREEERRLVTQSRELLASDRLAMLAGRESKIAEESKRTSEALSWLDRRLEADLRAANAPAGGGRYERDLNVSAVDVDVAVLASKSNVLPFKSKAEQLKDMVAQRNRPNWGRGAEVAGNAEESEEHTARSVLSEDAQRRLANIVGGGSEPSEHGTPSEYVRGGQRPQEGESVGLWAEHYRGSVKRVDPKPWTGIRSMSHTARTAAAPNIAHVYEQIFLEEDAEEREEAETARRMAGEADRAVGITLVLDEEWGNVQGGEVGVGDASRMRRSYFEERLLREVAWCMRLSTNRFRILDLRPGPSWYRVSELVVEMLVVPPPDEELAWEGPSCYAVAQELKRQAGEAASTLRNGSSLRFLRADIDKYKRLETAERAQSRTGPPLDRIKFSLLKGGLTGDVGPKALLASEHSKETPQHALYMANQVLPAAQRNEEGFWVDTAGRRPQLPRSMYGTWPEDQRTEGPRLGRQWRILGAGAAVMLILVLWVLYLREDVAPAEASAPS